MPSTGHAEHLARGHGVDVLALAEGIAQRRDVGHVGGEAQLDLRVVDRDQLVPLLRHEGEADAAPLLGADRDVLQVGIARGQAAGRRQRQRVRGVDAAGRRVDLVLQRVGIGALELGQLAPVQDLLRQRMAGGERQLLQDVGAGAVGSRLALLAAGQLQLVEQHLAQLLGRAGVELGAGDVLDLALDLRDAAGEIGGERLQGPGIDLDAGNLHRGHDRNQRPLDGLVQGEQALLRQARLQKLMQAQGHVGLLGGIGQRFLERHRVEGHRGLAGAGDVATGNRRMLEIDRRQLVEVLAVGAAFQGVGDQHGIVDRPERDAVLGHDGDIDLDVVPDLEHRRIFEQRLQEWRAPRASGSASGGRRRGGRRPIRGPAARSRPCRAPAPARRRTARPRSRGTSSSWR